MSNAIQREGFDEAELVAGLKQGSEDAYRTLVRHFQDRLFKVAYGILLDREEAWDIVQDVFFKVFQSIDSFKSQARLSTWLHRITVNHCLNWKRRWKRRLRGYHRPLDADSGDPEGRYPPIGTEQYQPERQVREKQMARNLWASVAELPEEARAVFMLKEVEGLSYDEIADILKVKRGTVSSRLFYARKRIKKSLAPYLEAEGDE
ncbi:MAG: sigma-70 family RNA polymerase sigma factor [Desulfobacterales bacterium]